MNDSRQVHRTGSVRMATAGALVVGALSWPAFASQDNVEITSSSAPKNQTYNLPKQCTGVHCNGDCQWTAAELAVAITATNLKVGNNISKLEQQIQGKGGNPPPFTPLATAPALPANSVTATAGHPNGKTLTCDTQQTDVLTVRATTPGQAVYDKQYTFKFKCEKCPPPDEPKSSTEGNGDSYVPPPATTENCRVQFAVMNLDTQSHNTSLSLQDSLGWGMTSSVPANVLLNGGETLILFVDANVPGGTPLGAVNRLRLNAALVGVPNSASSGQVHIIISNQVVAVAPELPTIPQVGFVAQPTPNPSSTGVSFRFVLRNRGRARVDVMDATGRRVSVALDRVLDAGPQSGAWDGRTRNGAMATPGVYSLVLRAPGVEDNRQVVITR